MKYRQIAQSEYHLISKLHLGAFEDFFLSTLGYNFLKTYYQVCLKNKQTIAICASSESDDILGFCIGCTQSKGFHKRLMLHGFFKFLYIALIILFTKPKALLRLSKNLEKNKINDDDGNYSELLSIAVLPDAKGSGIGKEMIAEFEAEAKSRGCTKVTLTTDYYNNDDVIAFYKKSGYEVFYEFTTYPNRRMYKLIKKLD